MKVACVVRWGVAGKGSASAETSPAAYPAGPASEQRTLTGMSGGTSPVNTDELEHALFEAERRVLKIQTKLYQGSGRPTWGL